MKCIQCGKLIKSGKVVLCKKCLNKNKKKIDR